MKDTDSGCKFVAVLLVAEHRAQLHLDVATIVAVLYARLLLQVLQDKIQQVQISHSGDSVSVF